MESFGTFLDEEWESLSKMFSGDQDYSDHFSGHGLFSSEQDYHGLNFETHSNIISSLMTEPNIANNHGLCYAYEHVNPNPNFHHDHFSQETSNINGYVANDGAASFPYLSSPNITSLPTNSVCDHDPQVNYYDEINNMLLAQVIISDESMEDQHLCLIQDINIESSVDLPSVPIDDQLKNTPAKRKLEMPESPNVVEDKVNDEKLKKKTRVSRANKIKKKVQPTKKQKVNEKGNDAEDNDNNNNKVEGNAPIASSSSCSSEDDLNGGTAVNSNWKTRAGRGAATDPQSLYARKRRERINERLKVLQNLVPNGTKVDISTMLEEAVQYVKFLQLQIKLLSSDEMWMYAPIAYNGMDMGLYQKLSQS